MTLNPSGNTITINDAPVRIIEGSFNVTVGPSDPDNGFGPYRNGDIITRQKDVPPLFGTSVRDKWHTYGDEKNNWTLQPSSCNFPIVLLNLKNAFGLPTQSRLIEEDLMSKTCFGLRLGNVFDYSALEQLIAYLKSFNFDWESQIAWYRRDCFAERGEYRHLLPTPDDFPIRLIRFPDPLVVLDKFDSEVSLSFKHPVKKYIDHFCRTNTLYYTLPSSHNDSYDIYDLGLTNKNHRMVDQVTAIKSMHDTGVPLFFTVEEARAYANEQKEVDHYV